VVHYNYTGGGQMDSGTEEPKDAPKQGSAEEKEKEKEGFRVGGRGRNAER